jgi:hypothetical protein
MGPVAARAPRPSAAARGYHALAHREPNRVVQGEARCPSRLAGRLRGVQPTVAQVPSLLQPPVGGCAVSAPRASDAQRRCRSARRSAARRRARMPSRIRAGAPPRRHRSRRSLRPATQAPLETSHRIRREFNRMPRVCRSPVTAVVKGDQDLSASDEGGSPLGRCGGGRVLVVQQNHRERSITRRAPRERHRPGCHGESAGGSMDICAAIERPLGGGAYPVRAARRGVRRPAACVFPFWGSHQFGS